MPYIEQKERGRLEPHTNGTMWNAGELNYSLTMMIQMYIHQQGLCYQTINDIIGALEGAKVEFQRRIVAPYEDEKILENGDVY